MDSLLYVEMYLCDLKFLKFHTQILSKATHSQPTAQHHRAGWSVGDDLESCCVLTDEEMKAGNRREGQLEEAFLSSSTTVT